MKKLVPILLTIFLFIGCGNLKASPTAEVEDFLSKYQKLDKAVVTQLDKVVADETNLTVDQKREYKKVMQKQYKDLAYEIKDEMIDGETAIVTVEINVYDYHKTLRAAQQYLAENPDQFLNGEDAFDEIKYFDYRIEQMKDTKDKIKYTLSLTLTKQNDKWVLDDLTQIDREKIHGLYNYS